MLPYTLRCGPMPFSVERFILRCAVPIPVGKSVHNCCFCTVHRINKSYKTSDSYVRFYFSRGTTSLTTPLQAVRELTAQTRVFVHKVHIYCLLCTHSEETLNCHMGETLWLASSATSIFVRRTVPTNSAVAAGGNNFLAALDGAGSSVASTAGWAAKQS